MADFPARGQQAPAFWDLQLKPYIDEADTSVQSTADDALATADAAKAEQDTGRLSEEELSATIAAGISVAKATPPTDLTPLLVPTIDLIGSRLAAPGVRTGLASTQVSVVAGDGVAANQGFAAENVATGVSGAAGAYTLTVTDTTTLATLDGAGTAYWDCAILNGDGRAIINTVLDVAGSTVTLLRPLPFAIAGGSLASRIDSVSGQHLTTIGTKALAQAIAAADPVVGTRGGIIEGQWDTLPGRVLWAKNAALTTYGVSSSSAPVVISNVLAQSGNLNIYDGTDLMRRVNYLPGGQAVGTHASGHGATVTLPLGRRPVVIEFPTSSDRSNVVPTARIQVVATAPDGTVLYDKTVSGAVRFHRIPVTGLDSVTIEVTNTDGGIYYIYLGQLTVREAGVGAVLRPRKALLLGDSWTQFYGKALGTELAAQMKCEVATFGKGGTTTDWGIAWLDYALAANPGCDTVIVHFYTNDLNNNQSTTMTIPGGSTVAMWPNGLTAAQAQARWISQMKRLVSMIQQRGLRPVVILPGTVNIGGAQGQVSAALQYEQPRLIEWSAVTAEFTAATSYLNTVGKRAGLTAFNTSTAKMLTATGSSPTSTWVDGAGAVAHTPA